MGNWLHPQVGKLATLPLPFGCPNTSERRGGGGDLQWPTSGQIGYITPAVSGGSQCFGAGTKSEVARTWADWLHKPRHLRGPQRFKAGDKIRSGPQVGK